MPGIATVVKKTFLHQTLVWWKRIGSDSFGKPVYGDAMELPCRWEDMEQEVISADNRRVWPKATVLLVGPVSAGDLIMLGTVEKWKAMPTYPALPSSSQGAREVLVVHTTPDIKALSDIYSVRV
jgi:hypothetical protein